MGNVSRRIRFLKPVFERSGAEFSYASISQKASKAGRTNKFFLKLLFCILFIDKGFYLCPAFEKNSFSTQPPERWQSLVYCNGLENRRTARYRGFESLPLRNHLKTSVFTGVFSVTGNTFICRRETSSCLEKKKFTCLPCLFT